MSNKVYCLQFSNSFPASFHFGAKTIDVRISGDIKVTLLYKRNRHF